MSVTEKDKAEFLALSPAEQKEAIAILQLLERDGVISPPVSDLFLAELELESLQKQ